MFPLQSFYNETNEENADFFFFLKQWKICWINWFSNVCHIRVQGWLFKDVSLKNRNILAYWKLDDIGGMLNIGIKMLYVMMKPVIGRGIDTVIHYHIVEQWVTHFLLLLQKTGILYFGRYIHWLTWCYQKPHTLHLIPHCITTTFNYYKNFAESSFNEEVHSRRVVASNEHFLKMSDCGRCLWDIWQGF